MTNARAKVLERWPDAKAAQWATLNKPSPWIIWPWGQSRATFILGHGATKTAAWQSAAEGLE